MKILSIAAGAAVLLFGMAAAEAKPCVNVQANVQNKSNNSRTVNQNCDVNISGNIQAGKNNDFEGSQTGDRNHSRSHQIGSESNTSTIIQRGRVNSEATEQRGRR